MVLSTDRFRRMFEEMEGSPGLNHIAGIVVFTIGVTILLVHPTSTRWPDILVAIFGWGALAEGLLFLAAPHIMWLIARPFLRANTRLWGGIAVAIGVALIVIGWSEVARTTVTLI
jgi:small neutral amino acid transporter SnatA (MarC family)